MEFKVSSGTIARIIVLGITLLNTVLIIFGKVPLDLDENLIYEVCSGIGIIASSVVACWKNNSLTKAAIAGDDLMHCIKEDGYEDMDITEVIDHAEEED